VRLARSATRGSRGRERAAGRLVGVKRRAAEPPSASGRIRQGFTTTESQPKNWWTAPPTPV
jgi:hypothetical protein